MKNTVVILFFLLVPFLLKAQVGAKTIVPNQPVVVGESFQVQYVFPGKDKIVNFKAPSFSAFRFVTGPNQYTGTINSIHGATQVRNFVFTLEALKAGRFKIAGAKAIINGKPVQSDDAFVEVILPPQAGRNSFINSEFVLRAGEDPYEKIRQNLFVKVNVDRSSCFVGEPILATFKLYSRLQSRSDIVKNPCFYGFSVYDMVNLADKEILIEEINGKLFDVHTIRKVQLFPLQEGVFAIDAMDVMNKVKFSRSFVNKKTEQEIVEGVLGNDKDEPGNAGTEEYETKISTPPVLIHVKSLPSKPPSFDGAVGHFNISSSLVKNKLAKNEEGVFEIIIRGQGNFIQLNAPVVKWPPGVEGFDPVIHDYIDKTQLPLKGSRSFHYSFVSAKPGSYELPPVNLTYFDPKKGYKTDSTAAVLLEIGPEEKKHEVVGQKKGSIKEINASASKVAVIIVVSLVLLVIVYWIWKKKEPAPEQDQKPVLPTLEKLLQPAYTATQSDDRNFYSTLQQCIWNFFTLHFSLSGSDMNKEKLLAAMRSRDIEQEDREIIASILQKCETGKFTQADLGEDKSRLIRQTETVLKRINARFQA